MALSFILYGCSSSDEQTRSCFLALPRTYDEGTACHALMEDYASLVDYEKLETSKAAGIDVLFLYIGKISVQTRSLRANFEAVHDVCGVLVTTSMLNEYQYFQQTNQNKSESLPQYDEVVYQASKHATCRYSGSEISIILTNSAILLRPRINDKRLFAALTEHYQSMADMQQGILSCPVIFMFVYMNVSVVKSSNLGGVIAQKIHSCLSDEPDPLKRKAMISVLDNMTL